MKKEAMFLPILTLGIIVFTLVSIQEVSAWTEWDNIPTKCYLKKTISEITGNHPTAIIRKYGHIFYFVNQWSRVWLIKTGEDKDMVDYRVPFYINTIAVNNLRDDLIFGTPNGIQIWHECELGFGPQILDTPLEIEGNITGLFIPNDRPVMYTVVSTLHNSEYKHEVYRYVKNTDYGENLNLSIAMPFFRNFVVDAKDNYYFYKKNSSGTPVLNVMLNGTTSSTEFDMGDKLHVLAADNYGKVYAASSDSFYRLSPDSRTPKFLNSLDLNPLTLNFNENNDLVFGQKSPQNYFLIMVDDYCMRSG